MIKIAIVEDDSTWVIISLICNGINNLWMPVASAYVAPAIIICW